jgi:hypothetical protein
VPLPPPPAIVLQIWVVSRYYGDDVHMSSLLERIAAGLQVHWFLHCRAGG